MKREAATMAAVPSTALEVLPADRLARYLDAHALGQGPLDIRRIGDGHSMLTFAVRRDGAELVVRRPPPPPIPPGFHDVLREARIIEALAGRIPVPRVLATCSDPAVLGVPFYVMEHLDGGVMVNDVPPALDSTQERRRIGEALVDVLVALHAIEACEVGLETFGRPRGFLERQLQRYTRHWQQVRTRELPAFDVVAIWLAQHLPEARYASIVHGDFRLGNVMWAAAAPARVLAVLDWEMAALGDPLCDLGYLVALWVQPDDPPLKMFELSHVTRSGGFMTREELLACYARRVPVTLDSVRWYEVLALWRLAAMMEGNYRRAAAGEIVNRYLRDFSTGAVELAERALDLTRGC